MELCNNLAKAPEFLKRKRSANALGALKKLAMESKFVEHSFLGI